MNINNMVRDALQLKATHAAIVEVADIKFDEAFRTFCEKNTCGSYNKNWMCPPVVGPIGDLKERVLNFKQGLLVQTVYELEDSFDWEGMISATESHTKIFRTICKTIEDTYKLPEILPLNVGPCTFCTECTFLKDEPCRFPEKAMFSVEACGIDVMELEKSCGIPYYNGKNTVSNVGLLLFKVDSDSTIRT